MKNSKTTIRYLQNLIIKLFEISQIVMHTSIRAGDLFFHVIQIFDLKLEELYIICALNVCTVF